MKSLLLFILLGFVTMVDSQGLSTYHVYTIEQFARMQFQDSVTFYKTAYTTLKYPASARENNVEGIVEVFMINHSDSLFETFITNQEYSIFLPTIQETMMKTRKEWLHPELPFMLRFCVEYTLISPGEASSDSIPGCKISIVAYGLDELRDSNFIYNIDEVSYKPQIYGYPYFGNPKKYKKKYNSIESIEELLEEAIRSCGHRPIHLKQMRPMGAYARESYGETRGSIHITFHSKGYISKVQLQGSLVDKKKNAEVILLSKLQGVQFKPALVKGKPVHVLMAFKID